MQGDLKFTEDLRKIATESFDLAGRLCGSCKNFHMLWPYNRLAEASGGDVRVPLIHSVLSRLLSYSGGRILIAGSADTGLLAVVARAVHSGTHITVLDRCETPLELCRRFAIRWSLPIQIVPIDLTELTVQSSFDVVFVHMLLQFIPANRHLDVLSRMRRSLCSDGRLVLVFRTSARIEGSLVPEYRRDYPIHLIEQLEARNVVLPESREAFRRRIEVYFEERRGREGAHANRTEVEELIKAAGFEIEDLTPIEATMSEPFHQFAASFGLQRFMVIARPSHRS
jgi:hypothetical protein